MTRWLARAVMALAECVIGARRQGWAAAMRAEFEIAATEGAHLRFARGCLVAALRELLTRDDGRFAVTSYALALGLMLPMAALQIGCALFGLPYLYPDDRGLAGAMVVGGTHETLLRGVYQAAVPSLALLQIVIALAQLVIAWMVLESAWGAVRRLGIATAAGAATLILFLNVLFLDDRQAMIQGGVLAIELASVALLARWHAQLPPPETVAIN